ncbi:hypothetical protein ACTA71_011865 [Dictyostelium dimigraforme]
MEGFSNLKGSLKEKIEKATKENKESGKPVFLMVGDSGVGKSTIITQIIKKISTENLEKMRINHTQEGTKGAVVMEEENLIIVDYKGKTRTENSNEYMESLKLVLKGKNRIEFLIGVVESVSARDDDIISLSESIKLIAVEYDLPFIILMNKRDNANSDLKISQYKYRKQQCKETFYGIKSSKTNSFYSRVGGGKGLCIGVFSVSAKPDTPIKMECPSDFSNGDVFNSHGLVKCCGDKGFFCKNCKKFYILSTADCLTDKEFLAITLRGLPVETVEVNSIGFTIDQKVMRAILKTCTDSKVFAQIVKTISSDYSSTFKSIPSMVEHKVFSMHWAQQDNQLAIDIAFLFDLKLTSGQPNSEEKKWTKVSLHSTFIQIPLVIFTETLNRLIVDPSRETLGASALFYGLKYKSIAEKFIDYISHHKIVNDILTDEEESLALAEIAENTIKHFNEREEKYVSCLLKRIENSSLERVCSELSTDTKIDVEQIFTCNSFKSKVKKATREFLKPIQVKCKKNFHPKNEFDNEMSTKEIVSDDSQYSLIQPPIVCEDNLKSTITK